MTTTRDRAGNGGKPAGRRRGPQRSRTRLQAGYRILAWGADPAWQEFEVARPGPGEATVRVEACGVGLTVLNCIRGDLADDLAGLPRVPGHELVGRVVEVGGGVDGALLGQRVAAYFYLTCGTCPECVAGLDDRCRRMAGYVGVHRDGGYAPLTTLPVRNLVPMPDGLDPVEATTVPDAVATPVHVCRSRAHVAPGDRVAVIGAGGGVGAHMVQVARVYGADVAGLDLTDDKLAAIEALGAVPIRSDDLSSVSPQIWTAGRPTVVVDLVGSRETLDWAARSVETGGRIVVLTTFRGIVGELDPRRLVISETAIIGSRYATRDEVRLAAELVASGRVRPVIGMTVDAADVAAIHQRLRDGTLVGRGALVWR